VVLHLGAQVLGQGEQHSPRCSLVGYGELYLLTPCSTVNQAIINEYIQHQQHLHTALRPLIHVNPGELAQETYKSYSTHTITITNTVTPTH